MDWKLEYYVKENGDIPVLNYLLAMEPKARAKARNMINLLQECGTSLKEPYAAPIKNANYKGLWELRVKFASNITRIFYFIHRGDTFILLHGIKKKTQKTPHNELNRALHYMQDFERRSRHGKSKHQRNRN